jgi:hypothetical protein
MAGSDQPFRVWFQPMNNGKSRIRKLTTGLRNYLPDSEMKVSDSETILNFVGFWYNKVPD